jgi:hypothetical protein
MASATPQPPNPAVHALRDGGACTLCLFLSVWLGLEHANLAVWTCHMVLSAFPVTVFQRGVERTLGRGVGILAAVVLVSALPDQPFLRLLLESLLLLAMFYGYFAGRFAYALLNAGLYLAVLVEMGRTQPEAVALQGWEMFLAVLLGSLVSDVVVWLTGAERDLRLDPGKNPLFPLRTDWLNHSAMMIVTVTLTLLGCRYAELPVDQSVISVMMLTAGADVQAILVKGELRLGGAILAVAYVLVAFAVLALVPRLSVLAAFLFAGQYIAAYCSKVLTTRGYLGVQMGLVVPLLLVVPGDKVGSIAAALQRIEGVVIAIGASVAVAGLWPRFPLRPTEPAA